MSTPEPSHHLPYSRTTFCGNSEIVLQRGPMSRSPRRAFTNNNMGKFLTKISFLSFVEQLIQPHQRESLVVTNMLLKKGMVTYVERQGSQELKHVVDFGSPRTSQAAAMLGIKFDDCVQK